MCGEAWETFPIIFLNTLLIYFLCLFITKKLGNSTIYLLVSK